MTASPSLELHRAARDTSGGATTFDGSIQPLAPEERNRNPSTAVRFSHQFHVSCICRLISAGATNGCFVSTPTSTLACACVHLWHGLRIAPSLPNVSNVAVSPRCGPMPRVASAAVRRSCRFEPSMLDGNQRKTSCVAANSCHIHRSACGEWRCLSTNRPTGHNFVGRTNAWRQRSPMSVIDKAG